MLIILVYEGGVAPSTKQGSPHPTVDLRYTGKKNN
jgi:hypothetical protein